MTRIPLFQAWHCPGCRAENRFGFCENCDRLKPMEAMGNSYWAMGFQVFCYVVAVYAMVSMGGLWILDSVTRWGCRF